MRTAQPASRPRPADLTAALLALALGLPCGVSGPAAAAGFQQPELTTRLTAVEPPVEAPGFELPDMDGESHRLADYRGKVVLLNFWATWCPPCRREMPSMERLKQKMDGAPFQILAINQQQDPDEVFAFTGALDPYPTFPLLFDTDSAVAEAYGVRGLPASLILDPEGRVVYRALGGREFDDPGIIATLRELLPAR